MWTEDCNSVPQPHANRIIGTHKKNAKEDNASLVKHQKIQGLIKSLLEDLSGSWVKFDGNYIVKAYEGGNQPLLTFRLES